MRTRLASALETSRGKEGQGVTAGSAHAARTRRQSGEWDMNLDRVGNEGEGRHEEAQGSRSQTGHEMGSQSPESEG